VTAVDGSQHACFGSGAGADPGVGFSEDGDVGAARGKRAFVCERWWQRRSWHTFPRAAAVGSRQDIELTVDGVAEDDAVIGVPEGHCV
jgi:hypothetical protein